MPVSDNFVRATSAIQKAAGDTYSVDNGDPVAFNFTSVIPSGETIATVLIADIDVDKTTSPALTFANPEANSGTYVDDDGTTIAIGKAVFVDCSGGKAGTDYLVSVLVTLSNDSVRGGKFPVQVR